MKFFSMKNFDGYDSFLVVANYISGKIDVQYDVGEEKKETYVSNFLLPFKLFAINRHSLKIPHIIWERNTMSFFVMYSNKF